MIRYDLRCAETHEFDGWFHDSAAFDRLVGAGLVECPACGSAAVAKRLMAPAIRKKGAAPAGASVAAPTPTPAPGPGRAVAGPMPAELRALLQRLRNEVERNCDYVGPGFADAARDLHRAQRDGTPTEADASRGIYGEATETEAEALAEEGIEIARIPWVPRADA